jgi:hypothetical protein
MEPTRMWEEGPLRHFSVERFPNSISYESPTLTGYVGTYVCERCATSAPGVYRLVHAENGLNRVSWVCSSCRDLLRTRKPQPEGLKRHREAKGGRE